MTQKKHNVRLPKHIIPVHYDIFLSPDLDNFVFQGKESITLKITKDITSITLHSAEIKIISAKLKNKKEFTAKSISYSEKEETVTFTFSEKVKSGSAKLEIEYGGILNDKMRGFYRSKYEHNGKTYNMGVTQFESTDARRAFPSFDEPDHKATFDVALRVPHDRTVISNTVETEVVEHDGGYKTVKFATTPKMSTYLLAFIIGHFEFIERKTPEGVTVRIYVTPGKKKQAEFALECASKMMSFYQKYFGTEYPLKTMDLIAIPDFAAGAMENWGAVTYREAALLVDSENSSLHTKQWVALVIAHELAHQWFGNLVTMKWWTHLWLNEGFASFMEYLVVDKLFPEWHVWTQFVFTEHATALTLDGLENTHPIEIPVHHPGEISEIFDAVSYSKGASVIRMLQDYIGEKDFQEGLILYLKTHKYSNAETEDLWKALEKISGKPVKKMMKNWTTTPGYPLVHLVRKGDRIHLSQERFFSSPLATKGRTNPWLIPFDIIADDKKSQITVLMDKKTHVIEGFSKSKWIKGNADEAGFIRVRYTEQELKSLEEPIRKKDTRLKEEGRFALIRDAFAQVEAGYLQADEALRLTNAYRNDDSYIVWAEIIVHLLELNRLLFGTKIHSEFQEYGRDLLRPVSKRVGYEKKKNETHFQTLLRSSVLYALGTLGEKEVVLKSKELFSEFNKGGKIDADLKGLVFALIAENGGSKEYKIFEKLYLIEKSEEEKDRYLRALTSFKDPAVLRKVLALCFSTKVRTQDSFKAVNFMSANPYGIDLAWEYVKGHWKEIVEKFGGGHLFSRFILPLGKFRTVTMANEIEKFFKKNKESGIERSVAQTVEKIRSNAEFLKRDSINIEKYLTNEFSSK